MIEFESRSAARPYWVLMVVAALVMGLAAGSVVALRRGHAAEPSRQAAAPAPSPAPVAPATASAAAPVPPAPPAAAKGAVSTVVLCYHRIADKPDSQTVLPPDRFEAQLKWLEDNRYEVLALRDVVKALSDGTALPTKSVVITFDDGFLTDYKVAYPLLAKHKMPATVFVYTGWVGKAAGAVKWEQLAEMQASGLIDVQSHTVSHANLVSTERRGGDKLRRELADSKAAIEERLGKPCTILAYPYGASNTEVRAATKAAGYEAALTVDGGPIASGDSLFKLGRRMVFRKDALETFATQRVAPRRLVLAEQTPKSGAKLAERPTAATARIPADLTAAKVFVTLDGKLAKHTLDAATGLVSTELPANLAGRHRVGITVVDGALKLRADWSFSAPTGGSGSGSGSGSGGAGAGKKDN